MELTEKSLTILREINNRIVERHFHEHTHVLYDIRTALGPELKTYVEIGSYVGSSASLLLSHPFPTRVICIDPCLLNTDHYKGELNQYDTIFRNLFTQQKIVQEEFLREVVREEHVKNESKDESSKQTPTQEISTEKTSMKDESKENPAKQSTFEILTGYSSDRGILDILKDVSIDLLFIDGGHGFQQVLDDFNNYVKFVADDGYIVFDDYLDDDHSPDVRVAVNKIVRELDTNKFQVIGTPTNKYGAIPTSPDRFKYLNEFILRKNTVKYFAIVIPTYKRKNGTTVQNIKNIVEFLSKQTYQNYHVFLVGDNYEDEEEFKYLTSLFPENKIYSHNNSTSYRKDYFSNPVNKWCIGGVMALKHGVEKAKKYGYKYYLHLDDDDSWTHDKLSVHRQVLEQFPEADFVFHGSGYCGGVLPREHREYPLAYNNLRPRECNIVHSSNCLSLSERSYKVFMSFTNNITEIAEKIKNKEIPEYNLEAFDAAFIVHLNSNSLTCLYIPKVLSFKPSDGNMPE
jgi:predicted O-methyltransferase YrrM